MIQKIQIFFSTTKTKSSQRKLDVSPKLIKEIENYKKYIEQKLKVTINPELPILFNYLTNKPYSGTCLRKKFNYYIEKANVKQIRIHDFRHSCASLLINNNTNIAVVSDFLGHSSIEETLDTYTHMFKDKLYDAVNTINKLTCTDATMVDFGS